MLLAICHSRETGWEQVGDLSTISDLREHGELVWAETDVKDLDETDIAMIAEEFSLHELAVEDAVTLRQRPKVETFPDHFFIVLHQLDEEDGQLEPAQISIFLGHHYVLVLHGGAQRILGEARDRWSQSTPEQSESSWLLYTLIDTIVDDFQRIADDLEGEIEELEELTLESLELPARGHMALGSDQMMQRRLYSLKQRLSRLRRYGQPSTRLVQTILDTKEGDLLWQEMVPLFTDIKDHALRIGDQVSDGENLTNALLDLRRGEQARTLNDVTKKLTGWAAIIAVPTLISSIYGMNFHLFPSEGGSFGFWFAVLLMVVLGIGLFLFFRRRNWI
ncbi:MAG: magnesium transporter CorA family protein [Actinomycetota bacterium]